MGVANNDGLLSDSDLRNRSVEHNFDRADSAGINESIDDESDDLNPHERFKIEG
jgi:hypothetical protein